MGLYNNDPSNSRCDSCPGTSYSDCLDAVQYVDKFNNWDKYDKLLNSCYDGCVDEGKLSHDLKV